MKLFLPFGTRPLFTRMAFAFLFLFTVSLVQAATITVTTTTTWNTINPGPTDIINIQSGGKLTIDVNSATCATMNVGGGNNPSNSTLAFLNSTNKLTVNGIITIGANGVRQGTLDMTNGGTLIANSIATSTTATNVFFTPGSGTVQLTTNNNLPSVSAFATFNNLTVNGGITTASQALTINGTLTITSGTFTTGSFTHTIKGDLVNNGTFTGTGSTIDFKGTVAQNISGTATTAFNNITISNTTLPVTTTANITVDGTMTVSANTVFSPGAANTIGGAGTLTGSGTVKVTRILATPDFLSQYTITTPTLTNLTVDYAGTATQTIDALNYNNLTISNPNPVKLASSGTIGIAGTFTPNTASNTVTGSTINFNGTGNQSIPLFSYNNLSTSTGGIKSLSSTTTVGGTLNVGTLSTFTPAGNNLAVTGATTVDGKLNIASTTGTKMFSGDVTIDNGGTWSETAASDVSFGGSLTNNGTFTASTGIHTFTGASKFFSGTNSISIPNVTISGTYTNSITAASQALTISTSLIGTSTGSLIQANNANLNIGGTSSITNIDATANGNTVNYNDAAQTVLPVNYYHLTLSGSGTKDISNISTVIGNLTLSGTATATTSTNLNIGGNLVVGSGTSFTVAKNFAINVTGTTSVSGILTIFDVNPKTFTGDVTINTGGVWTENSDPAISFGGSLTNNGTFTAGVGIHTFSGANPPRTIGGTNSITLARVALNQPYTNTGTLIITTDLTGVGPLTQGTSANLTIGGTTSTSIVASATGNTVTYNGTAVQTITGISTNTFYNLNINNAAGITLGQPINISGVLTLANGIVTSTATNLLTFNNGASVNRTASALTTGFVDGPMNKIGNTALTFPTGLTGVGYRPISISNQVNGSATDVFSVSYVDPNSKKTDARVLSLVSVTPCEYWNLNKTSGTTTTATITLTWASNALLCSGANATYYSQPTTIVIAHNNGTGNSTTPGWNAFGGNGTTGSTAAAGTVFWNGVSNFGIFTLGISANNTPLPVKLFNVRATQQDGGNLISWTNLTEENVIAYNVERSADGHSFASIAQLAPSKNNNGQADYQSLDATPLSGKSFYRVKVLEATGKLTYSSVMVLNSKASGTALSLVPNPASGGQATVQISNLAPGKYTLTIYSAMGQRISSQLLSHGGGSVSQSLNLDNVQPGYYLVELKGSVRLTQRLVIQ